MQNRVRYILHTRVRIERRRSNRKTVQCHNCQKWGHATNNCHAKARCKHCAGSHATKDCNTKTSIKCANCQGPHTANDTTCPTYTQRTEWVEETRNNQKKTQHGSHYHPQTKEFPPITHTDTPAPNQNFWKIRQQSQQQQQRQQPSRDPQQQQQESQRQDQQQENMSQHTHTLPTHTGQPPITFQQPIDSFRDLMSEFNTLHTLVNIDELLRAIKSLNTQLKQSTSPLQTFTIFTKFAETLDQYNLNRTQNTT